MKKIIICMFAALLSLVSCTEYDEVAIWNKNEDQGERLATLERLCQQMNTNISSLQQIIEALQDNDYVTGVVPVVENGETIGYTITFSKSGPVTIYHGEDGEDGEDGNDGATPVIGVRQDTDGLYYWTLNGEWLTDDAGRKVLAQGLTGKSAYELAVENGYRGTLEQWLDSLNGARGDDGKSAYELAVENGYQGTLEEWLDSLKGNTGDDGKSAYELAVEKGYQGTLEEWLASLEGSSGKSAYELAVENGYQGTLEQWLDSLKGETGEKGDDGIVPQLDIRSDGYWYISYDEGKSWTKLGQATGTPGQNGDSMFSDIDPSNPDYLILTLADGVTQIRIPYYREQFDLLFVSGTQRLKELTIYCAAGMTAEAEYELTNPQNAEIAIECISHSDLQVSVDKAAHKIIVTAPASPAAGSENGCSVLVFASDDERTIMRKLTVAIPKFIDYRATQELDVNDRFRGRDCRFIAEATTYDSATGIGKWAYTGTVESVEWNAFNSETALSSITLPEGIKSIGSNAFNYSGLEEISLPQSLTTIEQFAFAHTKLTGITLPANVETLESSAFEASASLQKVVFEGNKIATIQLCTFQDCSGLSEITLPEGITEIEYNAFLRCESLTEITIPDSVTEIGKGAFASCTGLTSATIGDGVVTIAYRAFGNCTGLKTVVIGKSIQTIGDQAFNTQSSWDQMSLTSVTVLFDGTTSSTFPVLESGSRGAFPKPGGWDPVNYKIYVPRGTKAQYQASWSDYSSLIVEM